MFERLYFHEFTDHLNFRYCACFEQDVVKIYIVDSLWNVRSSHRRYSVRRDVFRNFANTSLMIVYEYACFFYYYIFHFESMKFRSSRSQMSFEIDLYKSFAIFTGKHLCRSLIVIKFPACKPPNLLKRDSNTSVFLLILLNF